MKIGDIVINPYVKKDFETCPNPLHMSMVIQIGSEYTKCLRYDGKISSYYTKDAKKFEIVHHINLYEMIYNLNHKEIICRNE